MIDRQIQDNFQRILKEEEIELENEDEEKIYLNDIQDMINEYNKKIEEIFKEKETELMRV